MLKGNFMQQRRLRLGDILDDYCPRERRVTNHAVVAIVGDDVKQTRCTTCDVDHEYRHGKAPAPRRPRAAGVLAGEPADDSRPVLTRAASLPHEAPEDEVPEVATVTPPVAEPAEEPVLGAAPAGEAPSAEVIEPPTTEEGSPRDDDGPVHRRLIRATFPRPEGHVPERREPEFTVRQQGGRGRGGEVNGNSPGYRSRGPHQGHGGGHGGGRGFGARQSGGGFGYDQRNSGRGPAGRGGNRQGGGGGNRGPRHGGAGRKGGR
jgi:hypothetical protein